MMISVDLAVCVHVKQENMTARHDHRLAALFSTWQYILVCKSYRHVSKGDADTLRLSTAHLEAEFINTLPIDIKRGFILSKAVRITSIAKPAEHLSTFCLAEDVHIDDIISSHMLKSCLITLVSYGKIALNVMPCQAAIIIYSELKEQLGRKIIASWT